MKITNTKEKFIYFITGASGVGKTTLINNLKNRNKSNSWLFYHFDSIGVPSMEIMIEEYGSPSKWQEAKTNEWIEKLVDINHTSVIIFEGQVNLEFIKQGFAKYNFKNFKIILIDCSSEVLADRLINKRKEPHLVNDNMYNWLNYLRNQAVSMGATIIDTTTLNDNEVLKKMEEILVY